MGKIVDYFTKRRKVPNTSTTFDELMARVRAHSERALKLTKTSSTTNSCLGGNPRLPRDIEWPSKDSKPLSFLAALDLAEIAATNVVPWLPKDGQLLFFYDIDQQPWGFDPNDRGGWAVLHVSGFDEEQQGVSPAMARACLDVDAFDSLPSWERFDTLGIEMTDEEMDTWVDGVYELDDEDEQHQVAGFPANVQGDQMELECQLASHGIHVGDPDVYMTSEASRLKSGAADWRLLFQHAGDDESDLMWGDCGMIYFWVREQDAMAGDFSNTWLVLQCS